MGKRVTLRSMDCVFDIERNTPIEHDSYVAAYPIIVKFFEQRNPLTTSDVVLGSHIAYGWMPTILELHQTDISGGFDAAARTLNRAKDGSELTEVEVTALKVLVNRSIVGASKLLHFVAPDRYAIWDSRIYRFLTNRKPNQTTVNAVTRYLEYVGKIRELKNDERSGPFNCSVNRKLGYTVSLLRAAELIMFLNAPGDPLKAKDR